MSHVPPTPIRSKKTKRTDNEQDSIPLSSLSSSSPPKSTNKRQKRHDDETGIQIGSIFEGYDDSNAYCRRSMGLFVVKSMSVKFFSLCSIKCKHVKIETTDPFNKPSPYFEIREVVLPLRKGDDTHRFRFNNYTKELEMCSSPERALLFKRVHPDEQGKYTYRAIHHW